MKIKKKDISHKDQTSLVMYVTTKLRIMRILVDIWKTNMDSQGLIVQNLDTQIQRERIMESVYSGTGGTVFIKICANFPMKRSLAAIMKDIVKMLDVGSFTLNLVLSLSHQPHLLF